MLESGWVHSVDTGCTADGPGIRYTVFMQGCMMRCKYCHNRDTWDRDVGPSVDAYELFEDIKTYRPYMDASNGGVTVSGGEPLLQPRFITELFRLCKNEGITTCLDTNGFVGEIDETIDKLLELTDIVLLDIKQMDDERHIDLTQVSNRYTLAFAKHLQELNKPTWIRYVIVGGYTDDVASAEALADFIQPMKNVERIELLPYHELGKHKWDAMGVKYELEDVSPPTKAAVEKIAMVFKDRGINVR